MADGIIDVAPDLPDLIEQAAMLLRDTFRGRSESWQDLASARAEVLGSCEAGRISRVLVNGSGSVRGWIGGSPTYGGRVWEIHPLAVAASDRRRGIGRALVEDLERLAERRGALTLWAASDDEHGETSLSGVDLYADVPGSIRNIRNLKGHAYGFYLRLGFHVAGLVPDANGRGKPDIFLAKRVGR